MPPERLPLFERIARPGPKRLLALDGGGIRGLITIEILARLEELLREAYGDPSLVLADYFDYVAGTSTGAIIATCISLGLPVERIRNFYLTGGNVMFKPRPLVKQLLSKYLASALSKQIRTVLQHEDGRDRTLGDADLRTLLMVVMRNATTDSPWPLSNNPRAKYNDLALENCNLHLPLWEIVRASTAAPVYFPPQELKVGSESFTFVDGAITPYNNPSLALFLMATLPEYRLEWPAGEERLLLVSIGTGILSSTEKKLEASQMTLLYNIKSVPSALIDAALTEQDKLCRVLGRCRFGAPLDSEIGDLIPRDGTPGSSAPKQFTYVRYNPALSTKGLEALGLGQLRSRDVQRLDTADFMPQLMAVGKAYARQLDLAHFGPFDPRTP